MTYERGISQNCAPSCVHEEPMAIVELVDRDPEAKGQDSGPLAAAEDAEEAA